MQKVFVLKIDRKDGIPSFAVEATVEGCVDVARSLVEGHADDWDAIKKDLSVRRKWTDGLTTISIAGK